MYKRQAHGCVVFENNAKTLWGFADRNVSSNTCDVVYFACPGGRSYPSSGTRSVIATEAFLVLFQSHYNFPPHAGAQILRRFAWAQNARAVVAGIIAGRPAKLGDSPAGGEGGKPAARLALQSASELF